MTSPPPSAPSSAFKRWLLEGTSTAPDQQGFYEDPKAVQTKHHTHPWWKVMCLTGVDYFSSLGYQPSIAALSAGILSPVATLVLVLVTLFGALPMYRRVARESPHGDGSISMLERLLSFWPSKFLVLALIGFVATGFVITITLSAADAAEHLIQNPFLKPLLGHAQVPATLVLIALLGAVFLKGFNEAIGIAVGVVLVYLGLSAVVVGKALSLVVGNPQLLPDWLGSLGQQFTSPLAIIGGALLVFPKLALGLSGFETGVVVMPLIKGDAADTEEHPAGRIRNGKKLLTTAALIMSVFLITSSLATTLVIPVTSFLPETSATGVVSNRDLAAGRATVNLPLDEHGGLNRSVLVTLPAGASGSFTLATRVLPADANSEAVPLSVSVTPGQESATVTVTKPKGEANGRALAQIAHTRLGEAFGTVYDISTIAILWFAGASAMAGLLNIVPRYLPRYGMAPDWTRANRPLVLVFITVSFVVTLAFKADVVAQSGAYATGVLALMTSAAVAVTLSAIRHKERGLSVLFGVISLIFIYTSVVTVINNPEGLFIALLFIAAVLAVSIYSRVQRSFELRVSNVAMDESALRLIGDFRIRPLRLVAHRPGPAVQAEYHKQELRVRQMAHLPDEAPFLFLEVEVDDASDFSDVVEVSGAYVGPYGILKARGSSVPNTIAALMLHLRGKGAPPQVYMRWSEDSPLHLALRFLVEGEGDVPPLTHEILRRAEPDRDRRPIVHVGG
ncbi:APC family permease [Deinococcus sp.]|uniref:APC family permease n=1 Tax=Deinococcus sp. TaxID=47478 RepID=UPI0025EFA453|nr:APC family permease [Deinococcus sp.]